MTLRPGARDALWMAAGAATLLLLILLTLHFRKQPNSAVQLAFKAERADLVGQMQLGLASASEAEKSAVLAITDQESQAFADQARVATASVEEERRELEQLLTQGGTQGERALLDEFSQRFTEFQRIDHDLLNLAVQNTNLKAYALAFGPAASALTEMSTALSHLADANAASPDARKVTRLALGAEIAGLRIQALLPPHIAEPSDTRMDEFEALMAQEDEQVRSDLAGLGALPKLSGDADLATAASRYAQFGEIKSQILTLSRENTNVRSLSISLNQKRKVMLSCQEALRHLQDAILAEPIEGVTYGRPAKPR
jgi:tetratricopeptide (TPR) repeat protein